MNANVACGVLVVGLVLASNCARGQGYGLSPPDPSIENDPARSGLVLFGSAKDQDGRYLSGVSVFVESGALSFVAFTNSLGRYRIQSIPPELQLRDLAITCSKPSYAQIKIEKRPAPIGAISPLEGNCFLERRVP